MKWTPAGWLSDFDSRPEQHIGEPVLASAIIKPRQSMGKILARGTFSALGSGLGEGVQMGSAAWGAITGGAEGAIFGSDDQKHSKKNKVSLPETMYLVVGPTKVGVYGVKEGVFKYTLESEVVSGPKSAIKDIRMTGRTSKIFREAEVHFMDGSVLEIAVHRTLRKHLERVCSLFQQPHLSS